MNSNAHVNLSPTSSPHAQDLYDNFVCELFENQPKTLPHLQKLTIQRILELEHPTAMTADEYYHCKYLSTHNYHKGIHFEGFTIFHVFLGFLAIILVDTYTC